MLCNIDREAGRCKHHRGFGRRCYGDLVALRVLESLFLKQLVCLVEVVYVHAHSCNILRNGCFRNVNVEYLSVLAGISHTDTGNIFVVDAGFLMATLKAELLKQLDNALCVLCYDHRVECCDFHILFPFIYEDCIVFAGLLLYMLAEIKRKSGRRDHHCGLIGPCIDRLIVRLAVSESPVKQELIRFVKIIHVHAD